MTKKESGQEQEKIQTGNLASHPCACHSHCQCCWQYQDAYPSHDPFLIRRWIVVSGTIAGVVGAFLGYYFWEGDPIPGDPLGWGDLEWNLLSGLVLYFCCVTLGDTLSHFVLKLKPSSFVDEKELLKNERVTGEELDHYFDTRRYIRMSSLLVASLVLGFSVLFGSFEPFPAFCITYILSTIVGILAVRCFSKTKRPRLIRRDPRYDNPPWHRPSMSASEYALNYSRWQSGSTSAPPMWH